MREYLEENYTHSINRNTILQALGTCQSLPPVSGAGGSAFSATLTHLRLEEALAHSFNRQNFLKESRCNGFDSSNYFEIVSPALRHPARASSAKGPKVLSWKRLSRGRTSGLLGGTSSASAS